MSDPPNREIDFDFDFDSFVRAGEAKLRGREQVSPPTLGPRPESFPAAAASFPVGFKIAMRPAMGFLRFSQKVSPRWLGDWACRGFYAFCAGPVRPAVGFKNVRFSWVLCFQKSRGFYQLKLSHGFYVLSKPRGSYG